jgi:dihydroorotase
MLFQDATLADGRRRDVRVAGERIVAVEPSLRPDDGEATVDAAGRHLLPGAVDAHVHFREPGAAHKETWATGSASAVAGGVTTVVDMPNTDPPTTTGPSFDAKAECAAASVADYGINGGVTPSWDPDTLFDRPLCALGEVFLADSTGDMGIGTALFREAVERAAAEDLVVTVHAEDASLFDEFARESDDPDAWSAYRTPEAEVAAVERAVAVAADAGASLHVAHTSTPDGVDTAVAGGATCEVTPHHIFLSRDDYEELGTYGRMNPPLRSEARRAALFERVADGTVDLVATDHAPHARAEKEGSVWDVASGVPGVETMLPLLLAAVRADRLTVERVRDLTARRPAEVFDLPRKGAVAAGRDADLVLVDLDATREIRGADLHSKCGWTPFEGREGVFPERVWRRGELVYDEDRGVVGEPAGRNVRA